MYNMAVRLNNLPSWIYERNAVFLRLSSMVEKDIQKERQEMQKRGAIVNNLANR